MSWFARLFGFKTVSEETPIYFHNTLSGNREKFVPLRPGQVKMYNCGPTAYDVAHIGNLCSYFFADTVRRTLEYSGYRVQQVINITDFGHLSSDGDFGDDKMSKALKREKKKFTLENMRALAEKYTEIFIQDLATLSIDTDAITFPRASDYIAGQIAIIKALQEKGYTYEGDDGVYFDTSKFPAYGQLGNINLEGLREGARVAADERRNPTDFLLWKSDPKMGWDSPWGMGFPGWHIECSAMIRATLGDQIDIHTGGIDLMPTHHNNEIAQSESASGKRPFSRFWMHHAFLTIKEEKISKSVGNVINLSTLVDEGYHPLSLRYLWLMSHYRQPSNFTWEALAAAQTAFLKLRKLVDELPEENAIFPGGYKQRFEAAIDDDIDTPKALAVIWEMVSDKHIHPAHLRAGILEADKVLGLGLAGEDEKAVEMYRKEFGQAVSMAEIPNRVRELLAERELARAEKRWGDADAAREKIEGEGYRIEDTVDGPRVVATY